MRFFVLRLFTAMLAVWGALTIVFFALNMTGSPVALLVGDNATAEEIARLTTEFGYDRPLVVRYVIFLRDALTGQFPESLQYHSNSLDVVLERIPATLLLSGLGLLLGVTVGLGVGYLAANGRWAWSRRVPLAIIVCAEAVPPILLGVVLVLIFSLKLGWLPTGGSGSWKNLILPVTLLSVYAAPSIARVFRASIVSNAHADHVRTAEAKGLSRRMVRLRHIAANALIPVINLIGVHVGAILSGAVVTESLFSWPGVGRLSVDALLNRDYPLVLASVCVVAVGFVIVNLFVDIFIAVLDPRARER
nr:ABC transporter permease [Acuticoccus mangrovi]